MNFIDVYNRTGLYKSELPYTLGLEGAGHVEALGAGVTELRAGDHVAWTSVRGSYATHVIARPRDLVNVPAGVDSLRAAAVMLQGLTAHYLSRGARGSSNADSVACFTPRRAGSASSSARSRTASGSR